MDFLFRLLSLSLLLFLHLSLCSSSHDNIISEHFETWCKQHGKSYSSKEEKLYRLKVFEDNYYFVTEHNSRDSSSYELSLNAFADLTHHEFKASKLGLSASAFLFDQRNLGRTEFVGDVPPSLDWRKKGAVTGVKDQGSCGI